MDHEDVKTTFPPNLSSVQENSNDCYDTIYTSMSIIRKDHVKEQRKQFEKEVESSDSSVEPKVPAFRSADCPKSKSLHAPKHFQNRKNDDNDLNCNLLSNDSKPLGPLNHVMGTRKSLSVTMEMRLNAFEKSGLTSESVLELPAKPGVHPKPTHLSIKTEMKSPSLDGAPLDRLVDFPSLAPSSSSALAPSSPLHRSYSPKKKDRNEFLNALQESASKSSSPQQCSQNVSILKTSHSPAPDTKLSDRENRGFAIVGYCQTSRVDHSSPRSPVVSEKNLKVVSPVDSVQGTAKSVSPPPKPPRLLSELKQVPLPKPRKDFHAVESGTYEHLTNAISVVRTSDSKTNLHEVNCIELSRSNDCIVSPAVKEPLKSPPKFSGDRSRKDQWWENKFIRATKPTTAHAKDSVQRIHNPCYMYAKTSRPDDVIAGQPLVRHHSEENLDSTPLFRTKGSISKAQYDDGPVYHSPVDISCQKQKRLETVIFDKDGYAVPSLIRESSAKNEISDFTQTKKVNNVTHDARANQEERSYVKSKVSSAYAVLRLPMLTEESHAVSEQDEGDCDIDLEEHKRLLRHVSNVKYKTNEAVARYEKVRLASTNCLFQYAMIIGLCDDGLGNNIPKILFCFPREMMIGEKQTSSFCFPDADNLRPSTDYSGETFSFVLTSATGDRRYGLCKRYLSPGVGARLPEALYVVSIIGDSAFYGRLLDAVNESRFISMDCAEELLQLAYAKPFPQPNHEVYLWMMGTNNKKKPLILKRMPDLRFHMADFSLLLTLLDVGTLIKVFSAILLERKIIFIAEHLCTLSSCICAVVSLLYPFEWQHTFVTILPSNLAEVVEAPTPYLLGLLSSAVSSFAEIINQLDGVLVLDLDSGCLLRNEGDEGCIIPKKLQKALTVALSDDRDGQNTLCWQQKGQSIQDATVAEAFLRLFVETCGHYTEYVCCQQDGEIVFQRELFVNAVHSRSIRLFLEWFTQTQMFSVFVMGRLKGETERGYFEERILEYRQEMEETTSRLENVKAIGKKIAVFFQKSGDRLRNAFQKAVYV